MMEDWLSDSVLHAQQPCLEGEELKHNTERHSLTHDLSTDRLPECHPRHHAGAPRHTIEGPRAASRGKAYEHVDTEKTPSVCCCMGW
jgi:hypothetical protein